MKRPKNINTPHSFILHFCIILITSLNYISTKGRQFKTIKKRHELKNTKKTTLLFVGPWKNHYYWIDDSEIKKQLSLLGRDLSRHRLCFERLLASMVVRDEATTNELRENWCAPTVIPAYLRPMTTCTLCRLPNRKKHNCPCDQGSNLSGTPCWRDPCTYEILKKDRHNNKLCKRRWERLTLATARLCLCRSTWLYCLNRKREGLGYRG